MNYQDKADKILEAYEQKKPGIIDKFTGLPKTLPFDRPKFNQILSRSNLKRAQAGDDWEHNHMMNYLASNGFETSTIKGKLYLSYGGTQ